MSLETLRVAALSVTLLAACVTDLRRRTVPNALTLPALLLGLALASCQGGPPGLGQALAGAAVASLALLGYAGRMLGAGDVKLLWAVGALTGPRFAGLTLLCAALAGGLLGLAWLAGRGRKSGLPYAPAIALGALAAAWLCHGEVRE